MFLPWRSARSGAGALLLFIGLHLLHAQQPSPAPPSAAPGNTAPAGCLPLSDHQVPLRSTIQAKVIGLVAASRTKAGKKLWVNALYPMDFRFCRFDAGASIYGEVTESLTSKNPATSQLALKFDGIDCIGHNKQAVKLFLIGAIAPPDATAESGHEALPNEVHGAREIAQIAAGTDGWDTLLNPGGPPKTVKPGIVVGFKNIRLEPQAGPRCSARLSSTDRNIELGTGTILLLAPSASNR